METVKPLRLAVLISGSGTTLANLIGRIADGRLDGVAIVGVAASRDCPGLEHARAAEISNTVVPRSLGTAEFDAGEFSTRLSAELDTWQPDLIACGGFLTLYLPPPRYDGRVINIHPALLPLHGGPGMYGDRVHAAVLASGAAVSGCSVHFVSDQYDAGPVIARSTVAVLPGDTPETLGARVRAAEAELYPRVVSLFAQGRVRLVDGTAQVDGVPVEQG